MDGEKLLKRLREGSSLENIVSDVKNYLIPVHKHNSKSSDDLVAKCGVTALRMLRSCVQSITSLTLGSPQLASVMDVARVCYKGVCAAKSHMEITPLSLEKVLFHIMMQLVNKTLLMDALSFASYLHAELVDSRPQFDRADGIDNEFDTIAKQAFNQLWKACAQIEKSTKSETRHVLVLDARCKALAFVMLTNQTTAWIANAALRAGIEMERYSAKDSSSLEHLCQFFGDTTNGLLASLESKFLKTQSMTDLAKELGPVLEVCLQYSKYCLVTGCIDAATAVLTRIQACAECGKVQAPIASSKFVCAMCDIISISLCPSNPNNGGKSKPKATKSKNSKIEDDYVWHRLKHSSDVIAKSLENGHLESAYYQPLVDVFEFLRKQMEGLFKGHLQSPADVHSIVYQALAIHLDILETYKDHLSSSQGPADVYRGMSVSAFTTRLVKKQLSTLDFMATLTMQELNALKTGSKDEESREMFGSRAMTICKRTKTVMEDVSKGAGGVISVNEHRHLGSNAYNLGLICYKRGWYDFASSLVRLSCEHLHLWCSTEQGSDEKKVKESQLGKKYELLIDCQRRAGLHRDAMTTVALSLLVVPGVETDDIISRAEQWVKAKRDALKVDDDQDLRMRTLLDACEEIVEGMDSDQLSIVAVALGEELKVYRSQRHDTSVEQYAAIQDLLRMYSNDGNEMERASVLIQLTQLLLSSGLESERTPEEFCIQAIMLLEGIPQDNLGVHTDLLAQAKFWLYITQLETTVQSSNSSCSSASSPDLNMDSSQDSDMDAHEDKTTPPCILATETHRMKPLEASLQLWSSLLQEEPFDPSCFRDPGSTLRCLQVAADIMAASGKAVDEIRVLSMLSKLAHSTSSTQPSIEADLHLSRLLARVGLREQAFLFISKVEKTLEDVSESKRATLVSDVHLAKCFALLYSQQMEEFEDNFSEYLANASKSSGHRCCRTYLTSALAKELHASYLSLPQSRRNPKRTTLYRDEHGDEIVPIDLHIEAMRIRTGVAKIVMGKEMNNNPDTSENDRSTASLSTNDGGQPFLKWRSLASVLDSLSQVAQSYTMQGCVREAQCYITEGLNLVQKFQFSRRHVRLLQQLVEVQIMMGQEDECKAKLAELKAIVSLDVQHQKFKLDDPRTKKCTKVEKQKKKMTKQQKAATNTEESDEEGFVIKSRPLSMSRSLASQVSVDLSNSPSLRPAPACSAKLPEYVHHQNGCSCHECSDLSLHELQTAYYLGLASHYSLVCTNEAALATLAIAQEVLRWSKNRMYQGLKKGSSLSNMTSSSIQQSYHHRNLCRVLSLRAKIELELGKLNEAFRTAQEGLALCECNQVHLSVDVVVQASLHYIMAVAEIQLKSTSSGSHVCDSSWTLARCSSTESTEVADEVSDVAHQLSHLSMSATAKRPLSIKKTTPACRLFQNMLDTSSARPEMARKRDSRGSEQDEVLPEELGLFGDVVLDEKDEPTSPAKEKSKPSKIRAKSAVQATTKKGAVNFKVAKKTCKPSKEIVDDTDLSAPTDEVGVFSFDEETPCNTKRPTKPRARKGNSKKAEVQSQDTISDDHENDVSSLKAKKGRGRGRAANKKCAEAHELPSDSQNTEILEMIDEVIANFSDNNELLEAKPKRGRGRKAKDTVNATTQKETKPKAKRGRPKKGDGGDIENTRGVPDPENPDPEIPTLPVLLHNESLNESITIDALPDSPSTSDMESSSQLDFSLENISPCKHQPEISISDVAIRKQQKAAKRVHPRSSSKGSESSTDCIVPVVDLEQLSSSFLETPAEVDISIGKLLPDPQDDLDEIEIPRAGSDSEDTGKRGKRKGRGAKKTSGKTPIMVYEDVEAPRGCGKHLQESKSRGGSSKSSKIGNGVEDAHSTSLTDLSSIQEHLEQAYNLIKHLAPCPLYRHICQLLALCHGDKNPLECSHYLAEAASVTLRHQKLSSLNKKIRKLRKASDRDDVSLVTSLGSLSLQDAKKEEERLRLVKKHFLRQADGQEDNVIKDVANALPEGYTVCQLSVISNKPSQANCLTASSQLVLTRIQKGKQPLVIRLPVNDGSEIVKTLERILFESKETAKETNKRVWWNTRQRLDEEMQAMTKDMENSFLSCWKGLLQGSYPDQKAEKKLKSLGKRLCTSLGEASQRGINSVLCECLVDSFHHLTHNQTNQALSSLTGLQPGSEDLTQLGITLKELAKEWEKTRPIQRNLVVLILDTSIQQLPWESIPVLQDWPVCRLPNHHFLLSQLGASVLAKGVNPDKAYYVLNPTGDLDKTQETFQDWFQKENRWKGVIGRAPTKPEYASALTDHDLFVFCGHGTGREFLTGDDIQRLTCRAATLLIGCSSGQLKVDGCLDASGMALNYLLAECPCVVANLWDVTDRDIDRFLEFLLKAWLATAAKTPPTTENQSLAGLLSDARKACKLKHLIGFAPVLYGLPVFMREG